MAAGATLTDIRGFEHGLFSAWDNGLGLADTQPGTYGSTATGRTQGSAARHAAASGAASGSMRAYTGTTPIVCSFYFKIVTAPTVLRRVWQGVVAAGGRPEIQYDTDNKLQCGFVGGTFQKFAATVNDGAWHRLDIKVDINPNPRTFDAKLDGVDLPAQATLAVAGSSWVRAGVGDDTTVASAISVDFDDLVVSRTSGDYPLGEYEVFGILPGSDGTHSFTDNDFSTGEAGTQRAASYTDFHLMVDDPIPWTTAVRSTTDNITQRVIRTTGYVNLAPAAAQTGRVADGVISYLGYSSVGGTGTDLAGAEVWNSESAVTVLWGDIGGTLANYDLQATNWKRGMVTVPAATWTKTEIEAIRWHVGGASDITPLPGWDNMLLEVAYPVVSGTVYETTGASVLI